MASEAGFSHVAQQREVRGVHVYDQWLFNMFVVDCHVMFVVDCHV